MHEHDFSALVSAIKDARNEAIQRGVCSVKKQALPTWCPEQWRSAPGIEVTRLRIGLYPTQKERAENRRAALEGKPLPHPHPPDDENNFWAEAIKWGGRYFYCEGDTLIECSAAEYARVWSDPTLAYFSSTIPVHHRAKELREGRKKADDFHPLQDGWGRRGDRVYSDQLQSLVEAIFSDDSFRSALENDVNKRGVGYPGKPIDPALNTITISRSNALRHAIKDWLETHKLGLVKYA